MSNCPLRHLQKPVRSLRTGLPIAKIDIQSYYNSSQRAVSTEQLQVQNLTNLLEYCVFNAATKSPISLPVL